MSSVMSDSNLDRVQNSPRGRLIELIREILGPEAATRPLPIDARLGDLGMSSMKMVNLMLAVEAEFGVTIPPADITPENFQSIVSVEALLLRLNEAASAIPR